MWDISPYNNAFHVEIRYFIVDFNFWRNVGHTRNIRIHCQCHQYEGKLHWLFAQQINHQRFTFVWKMQHKFSNKSFQANVRWTRFLLHNLQEYTVNTFWKHLWGEHYAPVPILCTSFFNFLISWRLHVT